jgi:acyl carrier protein
MLTTPEVTAQTEQRIQRIFQEVFQAPNLVLHRELTAQEVANWTSITHTEMLSKVEKEFAIQFSLKEVRKFRNTGDLIDAVLKRITV